MNSIKNSPKKRLQKVNSLETLRDAPAWERPFGEVANQLFGYKRTVSAEIEVGGSLEISELLSGRADENKKLRQQVVVERRLREEEKTYIARKTNELRVQIEAIRAEVMKIAEITPQLSQEVDNAAFAVNSAPSEYELNFLQVLFEFIKSFRKRIESANEWLAISNKRAAKKNAWGANYKKHGAKYLLSGEHYLQRSAG